MEKGIFLVMGDRWKQGRNIMSQAFNFDSLVNKVPLIKDVIQEAIDDIIKSNKVGDKNLNIINEMQNITGEIALRGFFGNSTKNIQIGSKPFNQQVA